MSGCSVGTCRLLVVNNLDMKEFFLCNDGVTKLLLYKDITLCIDLTELQQLVFLA